MERTKMRGARKHEGEIELKPSYFVSKNGQLADGNFTLEFQQHCIKISYL